MREALGKAMRLDGEHVLTALGAARWIGRHEGVRIDASRETRVCRGERKGRDFVACVLGRWRAAKRGEATTFCGKRGHVYLGGNGSLAKGTGLREKHAVLGNEVMCGEHEVLRGLPHPALAYT